MRDKELPTQDEESSSDPTSSSSADEIELESAIDEIEERISNSRSKRSGESETGSEDARSKEEDADHTVEYWTLGRRGKPKNLVKKYPPRRSNYFNGHQRRFGNGNRGIHPGNKWVGWQNGCYFDQQHQGRHQQDPQFLQPLYGPPNVLTTLANPAPPNNFLFPPPHQNFALEHQSPSFHFFPTSPIITAMPQPLCQQIQPPRFFVDCESVEQRNFLIQDDTIDSTVRMGNSEKSSRDEELTSSPTSSSSADEIELESATDESEETINNSTKLQRGEASDTGSEDERAKEGKGTDGLGDCWNFGGMGISLAAPPVNNFLFPPPPQHNMPLLDCQSPSFHLFPSSPSFAAMSPSLFPQMQPPVLGPPLSPPPIHLMMPTQPLEQSIAEQPRQQLLLLTPISPAAAAAPLSPPPPLPMTLPYVANVYDFHIQASFKEKSGPMLNYSYYVPPRTSDDDFFGGQLATFQLKLVQYFIKYQPHYWRMHGVPELFNMESFLGQTMDIVDEFHIVSKLRFCCRSCKTPWTSKKGTIVFKFCFNAAFQQGWILMRIFGQICMKQECNDWSFQNPACYPEEIDRAMRKLSEYVGSKCYGIAVLPDSFAECCKSIRRTGNEAKENGKGCIATPHKREFCQACITGVCKTLMYSVPPQQVAAN